MWVAGVLAASPGLAQPTPEQAQSGDGPAEQASGSAYTGVVPGRSRIPAHVASARDADRRMLSWVGLQMRPDGASRFFVQLTSEAEYEQEQGDGRFVVVLKGTAIHQSNSRRPLETRFFNTPVRRAHIERRGEDLAFVLELREGVSPFVKTDRGPKGLHYVYVEFPPGNYLEDEGSEAPSEGDSGSGESTGGSGE